ncbi:dUTPase [Harp seal herpesvirus]|uniref:dUTPase n=1 Tax=phocid gammaherpesvirus 3 TaxID=2560643 RepID=A0A0R5ZAN3_9GAMA|nr:dUTPase [Harp seal herpesvirus]AJG42980.1 dUTPase [Harp seal herpesvirus]
MALRKQRPEVYFEFASSNFFITSENESSKFTLTNLHPILVRPHTPTIVSLGVKIVHSSKSYGFILYGHSKKAVSCHLGIIDPDYAGELKLIICNKLLTNITLFANQLTINLLAFFYFTPVLHEHRLLNAPHYANDVGYDFYLPEDIAIFPLSSKEICVFDPPPISSKYFVPVIFGRSGLATNGLFVTATKWTSKPLVIQFTNYSEETVYYKKGTRICQVVFILKRHLPSRLKYFMSLYYLTKYLVFSGATVSFVDIENDQYQSLVTLPQILPAPPNPGMLRGSHGFGSSGTH